LLANGYYDFVTPYFGTKQAISQLAPDLRARVSVTYYEAGHLPPREHREVVAEFIQSVTMSKKNGLESRR
jgi:carboxypeptidase C (cathepsin A)